MEPLGTVRWSHASLLRQFFHCLTGRLFADLRRLANRLAGSEQCRVDIRPGDIWSLNPPAFRVNRQCAGERKSDRKASGRPVCQERVRPLFFSLALDGDSCLDLNAC